MEIDAGIDVVSCFPTPHSVLAEDSVPFHILVQKEWTKYSHVTLSGGT